MFVWLFAILIICCDVFLSGTYCSLTDSKTATGTISFELPTYTITITPTGTYASYGTTKTLMVSYGAVISIEVTTEESSVYNSTRKRWVTGTIDIYKLYCGSDYSDDKEIVYGDKVCMGFGSAMCYCGVAKYEVATESIDFTLNEGCVVTEDMTIYAMWELTWNYHDNGSK